MARELLETHGLDNMAFGFDGGKRRIGSCRFMRNNRTGTSTPYKITLSRHWLPYLSREEIKDTILHEIAHAIAGHEAGHGYRWKQAARKVGANPSRLADLPPEVSKRFGDNEAKYSATCGCEGRVYYFHRMTRRYRYGICGVCMQDIDITQHY